MLAGCNRLPFRRRAGVRGKLRLCIFADYIPEALLQRFTRQTGCEIQVETYSTNDQLYSQIRSAQVQCDLIMPSDYMVQHLFEEGLLKPLDLSKITRLELVNQAFHTTTFDPENRYSVPYIWGSTGIGYDSERVSGLPKSWSSLFLPQDDLYLLEVLNHHPQELKVSLLDEARSVVGCTLIYLGLDPNSRDPKQITQAFDTLWKVRDRIDYFVNDHMQELLRSRSVGMAMAWTGDVARAMRGFMAPPEGGGRSVMRPGLRELRISLPQEGSILFRDCFALPAMVQNYDAAHALIDFLLEPAHAAEMTNFSSYANTVDSSRPFVDRFILNGPAYFMHSTGRNHQLKYNVETDLLEASLWQEFKSEIRASPPPAVSLPVPAIG
jgi:spermidine/putrescine-binding protein